MSVPAADRAGVERIWMGYILELYRNLSILDKALIVIAILVVAVGVSCLA